MTYTVFEHNHGENETQDMAPGRGGYSKVLVPLPPEEAVLWWEEMFGQEPDRIAQPYVSSRAAEAWNISEELSREKARQHCGELTLDEGGIGVPMTRYYTWSELNGRLDIWAVGDDEL